MKKWGQMAIALFLAIPIGWQSWGFFQRPARTELQRQIAPGIAYQRLVRQQPRPIMFHLTQIDLTRIGVRSSVPTLSHSLPVTAMTVTEHLVASSSLLAINASYFYPFREELPWDYYPKSGDRAAVVGEAISQGKRYSQPREDWIVACFDARDRIQILNQDRCPNQTQVGVAGDSLILLDGKLHQFPRDGDRSYARTILGSDRSGNQLWILVVDGKQMGYSEGATLQEAAEFLQSQGVVNAVNLDGGGSVTLAARSPQGVEILNAPMQNKIPMNQRPVANYLGFYAK
ncbi:MAG: phosphodiester glycosidase family protein [Synechococcales bacterium]|nr:phosphodiester glycosidase family protein [Synechococcales bacterium]